jgi:hypothetical protein
MMESVPQSVRASAPAMPVVLEWSLYGEGHVLAGTLVALDVNAVEAQILLDGHLLYRSRHMSRDVAREELMALRGHWANEGWSEPN